MGAAEAGHARLTRHAERRCRQRGLSATALHGVIDYGRLSRECDGVEVFWLDQAGARSLRVELGSQALEFCRRLRVVTCQGRVVTAYRTRKRHKLGLNHRRFARLRMEKMAGNTHY